MNRLARYSWRLTKILALGCLSTVAYSGLIVGIDNGGSIYGLGMLYTVDPITGATTLVGPSGGGNYPVSSSPVSSTYFVLSPINLYRFDYPNGGAVHYLCPSCSFLFNDYAYDSANGEFYGLDTGVYGPPAGLLVRLTDTGATGYWPGAHILSPTAFWIDPIFASLSTIEYVPGFGIYGTNGFAAYSINETTGALTALPSLHFGVSLPPLFEFGPPITGLAYDAESGRLIGTAGNVTYPGESPLGPGYIYDVNPATGVLTVLNSNAPNMFGIAAVSTPEPCMAWLLVAAGFCLWSGKVRLRALSAGRDRR